MSPTAIVVGVLWAMTALAFAWSRHAPHTRMHELVAPSDTGDRSPRAGQPAWWRRVRVPVRLAERLGGYLRQLVGLPRDAAPDRHLGLAVAAGGAIAVVSPVVALPVALGVWWAPWIVARRQARAHHDRVLDAMPDTVDLFRLALGSGTSLRLAVGEVAGRCPEVIGQRLGAVQRRLGYGDPLVSALAELEPLGEPFRPALDAMLLAERYGAPIIPLLDRIASDARGARRRRAEEVARRVPVKLLFPLVFCTLPAFGLLTVVPLLASALGRLSF